MHGVVVAADGHTYSRVASLELQDGYLAVGVAICCDSQVVHCVLGEWATNTKA